MTEQQKMPNLKSDREYRHFLEFEIRSSLGEDQKEEMYVEGYACTFNNPTVIWEYDGIQYKETVDDRAFEDCDMSDVIFNFDHAGKVMARTRNKTLQLSIDSKGLFIRARLDGTEEGRKLYEEIRGGYIDRMSFAFSVKEEAYDRENYTRILRRFKKLYDVSAVSIPAYESTSISARSFFTAQIEAQRNEETQSNKALLEQRKKLLLLTYL
ncbi:HK97 family phage prohead protease [Paenibacillus sp. TRM 82003]|nr:HK97 family phage prohead protease [Paenibacillus sp. TRM 82003]